VLGYVNLTEIDLAGPSARRWRYPIPSLAGRSSKIVHITMTLTGPPGSRVPSAGPAFSLVQKEPTPADNVAAP
jgi:hypothetical protein